MNKSSLKQCAEKTAVEFIRSYLLCLFFSFVSCIAVASEQKIGETEDPDFAEMSLRELMDVEVFTAASLLPKTQAKAPGTVYSFNRDDFARLGIRRLDDIFSYVPGFQLNQYRKRHRKIWARGAIDLYNDKIILLVDGVRRQHAYYGHFSLGDNFPVEKVEKVEIILGPASSLYGANAFAGIISVTTRDFSESQKIEVTAEGGTNARGKGTLLYNGSNAQFFGSYLEQDAPFREERKSFIGGRTEQPRDEDYTNLFFKTKPVEGLTLSADYYRDNSAFLFIPSTQDSFIEAESLTISGAYETGDLDKGMLQANLYATWDTAREFEKEQKTRLLGYEENQDSIIAGGTITGFKRFFEDHVVALGFNWMHTESIDVDYERRFHYAKGFLNPPEKGALLSDPDEKNDDIAVYLQEVWTITPELELTLGGRFDHFEEFGNYFNYRAALVYSPTAQQTVKLLYGTAIRTPTFREYLKVLEGTNFKAPIPDPERMESVELGYQYQWRKASFNLALFHNEVKDYIHVTPTPDAADEYFANSSTPWTLRGVEAMLRVNLLDNLDIRMTGAYLDAEERGGKDLPYLANWTSSFALNYEYIENHRTGFSLIYNSRRKDTNKYANDDPGAFFIANLFLSGEFNRSVSYSFGIDNVFDAKVHDPAADFGNQYNTERSEREIWGRLKWSFDL